MAEFERGDLVVYAHTRNGVAWLTGSLGIVLDAKTPSNIEVDWIIPTDALGLKRVFAGNKTEHYDYNLEKVGHLDDF